MAKQKSKDWLNKYVQNVPKTFGKTVARIDETKQSPALNYRSVEDSARIEREKELARRQTYLNPASEISTAPAMRQAAEDRIAQEKANAFTRKIAEGAQTIGTGLELAAPFTGAFMPLVGGVGAGLGIGSGTYLAGKDALAGNYGDAAMNAGFAGLDAAGFAALRNPAVKDFVQGADHVSDYSQVVDLTGVSDITKNLQDLTYAKKFAEQYGYKLPENLQRIAKSDELTNRTIRGMMDRHNTFVRGVSTNWDVIAKKNPEILKHLEQQGIDWKNNSKAAAEYMSTHIPINTGYGRVGLNEATSEQGLSALYTSNSVPTAEGYTYGKGFITKAKRPTDYSSLNRKDWIDKNTIDYYDNNLPNIPEEILNYSGISIDGVPKRTWELYDYKYNPKDHGSIEEFKNKYLQDLQESAEQQLRSYDKYKNTNPQLFEIGQKNYAYVQKLSQELANSKWERYVQDLNKNIEFNKNVLKTDYSPANSYAHYLHLGNPGEQVLQPIKSWEITPETWVNKSRAHINIPTDKLSRAAIAPLGLAAGESLVEPEQKKNGGWLDKYEEGGELNYNDASTSFPPNFVGAGYDTTGRDYSPAWGGQFQMGGSMPGAVGFMYARTGAPSKGPRRNQTSVTDASAQDGIGLPFINDVKLRNTLEGNKPELLQPGDYRLPEGRMAGSIYPSSEVSRSVGGEDGEPAYLIPSFKYGAPLQDYVGEYNRTGQYLGGPFKTWQEADEFGKLRHQYIDKEYKTLPSPIKTWGDGFQNGGEMKYYQEGLDFKPKSISKNGKKIIKDDLGQWAHPGKVTQIGSNQITMQGVPYPVLGISDSGDTQMMYPNEDYTYHGSSVTEYPMMKEGGALQLTKLDQLTNFTNYNTKQPGGWLDKYQD